MMAQLRDQMDILRTEQANERVANRAQVQALQEELAALRATPTGTTTPTSTPAPETTSTPPSTPAPPTPPVQTKKKMTLPDPPRFDGNRKNYRSWKLEMEGKLRTDGCLLGPPVDQFTYIYSRLGVLPQAMAAAFYESGGPGGARNPADFLRYLTSTYEDPNVAQHALNNLDELVQGEKESFAAFYPKFEKELADAVRINYLRRVLNKEMKSYLISMLHLPKDYLGFVRELHELGANIDAQTISQRRAEKKLRNLSSIGNTSPTQRVQNTEHTSALRPDVMDWEPTKINRAIQRQNKELVGKRAKWASEEEVQRRRREGLCTRCGRKDCWSDKCPLLPFKRPNSQTHVKRSTPKLPAIEDMVDSESDASDQTESEDEKLKE
jgi:hypothetical protein